MKTVNNLSKSEAEALVFKWFDTKETRAPESKDVCDPQRYPAERPDGRFEAVHNFDIDSVLWSNEQSLVQTLAA